MASAAWLATSRGVIVLASSVTGRPPPGAGREPVRSSVSSGVRGSGPRKSYRQAPDEKRSLVRYGTFRLGGWRPQGPAGEQPGQPGTWPGRRLRRRRIFTLPALSLRSTSLG